MRGLLSIALLALLPLTAVAQWHGAPSRIAPTRAPMLRSGPVIRPFMGRPFTPNPRGGGLPIRPSVPGVIPQGRFHGHGGFHGGRMGFGPGFAAYPFGVPPQNRCFSDAFFDPYFCTRRPVPFRGLAAFGAFGAYPYYSLPVIWDSGEDYADQASQQMAQQNAQSSAQASDLTSQIEQLREELRQLREQQSVPTVAAAPAPPPAPEKQEPPTPTTLIFRDGRRSQVENYAIVGNTLWVFHDQRRQKIPIAELDLQATQQANQDQGVDFSIPAGK